MKLKFIASITLFLSASAFATTCTTTGSGSMKITSCSDGNQYTSYKSGSMTITEGYNMNTGSSWESTTYKNSTGGATTYGTDSKGNSWDTYCDSNGNCY